MGDKAWGKELGLKGFWISFQQGLNDVTGILLGKQYQ